MLPFTHLLEDKRFISFESLLSYIRLSQVLERNGSPPCVRGRNIKCGQKIRLMHLVTRRNLHSHHFKAPLSDAYEVSAFGEDGVGDQGALPLIISFPIILFCAKKSSLYC